MTCTTADATDMQTAGAAATPNAIVRRLSPIDAACRFATAGRGICLSVETFFGSEDHGLSASIPAGYRGGHDRDYVDEANAPAPGRATTERVARRPPGTEVG